MVHPGENPSLNLYHGRTYKFEYYHVYSSGRVRVDVMNPRGKKVRLFYKSLEMFKQNWKEW